MNLGIIPDGNRRYAKRHNVSVEMGHKEGCERFKEFLDWCQDYKSIKSVTVYALSFDNLKRNPTEVFRLWKLYKIYLNDLYNSKEIDDKNIKVNVIGDSNLWDIDIKKLIENIHEKTKNYSNFILNILLAYSGRKHYGQLENLDLVIRTGGQHRLSDFMLYESAYAEIYFTQTLFPDFSRAEFEKIIKWYHDQKRNFGV